MTGDQYLTTLTIYFIGYVSLPYCHNEAFWTTELTMAGAFRDSMQHCPEKNDSPVMATDLNVVMGSGSHANGSHAIFLRLSGCSILPWSNGKWPLSGCCLLPFDVV